MRLAFMNNPRREVLDELRWAAANGFDCIDLTIEGPLADLDRIEPRAIRAILDESGMGVVGHTAWYLPFASPVERVRQAAIEEVAAALPVFAAIGARLVNVHIAPGKLWFGSEHELRRNGQSFAELADLAEPYGIRIIVEHPPEPRIDLPAIQQVLGADARLGFHLDVGHAFVAGIDLEHLLAQLGPRLLHVHFSDNRGRNDDHMPIGAGQIDWPQTVRLLKQAGYDSTITLEVFDQDDHAFLLLSAQRVRDWWAAA